MMNKIKVSIIVPVYNVEKYLDSCIQSLISQTLDDIEIILVDDESPDRCPQMCDEYAFKDKRIKVIHKKNAGLGMARNSGLEIASGEYVTFCDSDDIIALNAYEFCYYLAKKYDADECRFLYKRFSDGEDQELLCECPINDNVICSEELIEKMDPMLANMARLLQPQKLNVKSTASSCTALYKRNVIEKNKVRFHSERELICEDFIFNIDFAKVCSKIVFTENYFYNYRHNYQSLTMTVNPNRFHRNIEFMDYLSDKLEKLNYPSARIFAYGHLIGCLLSFVNQIFNSDLSLAQKQKLYKNCIDFDKLRSVLAGYSPIKKRSLLIRLRVKIASSGYFWLCLMMERVKRLFEK